MLGRTDRGETKREETQRVLVEAQREDTYTYGRGRKRRDSEGRDR